METMDLKRVQRIIKQVAAQRGLSTETVQREMQTAIDDAFSNRHEPGHAGFIIMFGDRCPSVEEFILKTVAHSAMSK